MSKRKHIITNVLLAGLLFSALLLTGNYWKSPYSVPTTAGGQTLVGSRNLPIYEVKRQDRKIALTFDAAWGNEDTGRILDILEKENVKATFFATGGWVQNYPEDVKAILAAGHDLGNHSENHKMMSELNKEQIRLEIMSVHDRVKELTGYDMFLFRCPYGDYDNRVITTVTECGYYPIQWDVDSLDWKDYGGDAIMRTVCEHKNLGGGSIILCHNGAKYTAEVLEKIIDELKHQGYEFVAVSELIYLSDYHMNANGVQIANDGKM